MASACSRCGAFHLAGCTCSSEALTGQVLGGKYEILGRLASGGMGTIYEARHVFLGRHVAVKILHAEYAHRPRIVQRFVREAQVVSSLASDHIVAVLDFGELSGVPYFV